jgi:hypothetical protein
MELKRKICTGMLTANNLRYLPFIWRDIFDTNYAAGALDATAAEPGPTVTRHVVDTESKLSTIAGNLYFAGGKSAPGFGDPSINWGSMARATGRAMAAIVTPAAANTQFGIGMDDNGSGGPSGGNCIVFGSNGLMNASLSTNAKMVAYTAATEYPLVIVQRTAGAFMLVKLAGVWTLQYIDTLQAPNPAYPYVYGYNAIVNVAMAGALDLPEPWNTDNGIATQDLAGARSAGDTFSHDADCWIITTITTLPSAGTIDLEFRKQDADNYWQLVIASDGSLTLNEVVTGVATSRGTGAAASIANGQKIKVLANGQTIKVYANDALKITYASASNFATATAGSLSSEGTGGAVTGITSYPYIITGAALGVLNRINFT